MLIKLFTPLILFSYVTFPFLSVFKRNQKKWSEKRLMFVSFLVLPNAFGAVLISCIINGYTVFGIMPVMIEYGCER